MNHNISPKKKFLGLLITPSTGNVSDLNQSILKSSHQNHPEDKHNHAEKIIRNASENSSSAYPSEKRSDTSITCSPASTSNFGNSVVHKNKMPLYTPSNCRTPKPLSTSTPACFDSVVYAAVVEGRGLARGEIGLASIDLRDPILHLSQFCDGPSYHRLSTKLNVIDPVEVLMPNTVCDMGQVTQLYQRISQQDFAITSVQRKYFNESTGLQFIKNLIIPENKTTLLMEVASKYYCLACAAALIKYVEFVQNTVLASSSLKFVYRGSEESTMIDISTVKNLELLVNLNDPKSAETLYGIMNHTQTRAGSRLLRANIIQPPCDQSTIELRQDAVSEFLNDEQLFQQVHSLIGRFTDVGHLLSMLLQINKKETVKTAENKLTNLIFLKHSLSLVEPLREALAETMSPLLRAFAKQLENQSYVQMLKLLHKAIKEDTHWEKGALNMCIQKCFAIKPNINGLLDISRRTYSEIVDDIYNVIKQLAEEHQLPLKLRYNASRRYYIQLCIKESFDEQTLPDVFIKVQRQRNSLTFITSDLIKLNDRLQMSLDEIYIMSNMVVTQLMEQLRESSACLYILSQCVAMLDMLISFAYTSTISDYVKPEFTDTMAIKQGRHPILDKIRSDPIVPNNTYISDENNFQIITGPNMSGKTTYLRQVALIQIMAQCGSCVPAQYASLRIADQIFSRIGSDDDLETNASAFHLEMREISYILHSASDKSLVIIDELGRGTDCSEGASLCHAICEELLKLKAFTFFVTHFQELTCLATLYPNAENYHFEVQRKVTENHIEKTIYTHILTKGKVQDKHYGLQLAAISCLPRSIVDRAYHFASIVSFNDQVQHFMSAEQKKEQCIYKLAIKLEQVVKNSRLDSDALRQYLQSLKTQFITDTSSP